MNIITVLYISRVKKRYLQNTFNVAIKFDEIPKHYVPETNKTK